jgi:endonuclease/exonuclease/phosphatase (EEP) superfamily protein YafD
LRGQGFGLTSTGWLSRRIDYLLVGGVELGDIRVLDAKLSDHRPVTATFSLPRALAQRDGADVAEQATAR